MLKKTITYTDYDGNERTEDFYFNLNKAELLEMELNTSGGLQNFLQKIIDAKDVPELASIFKKIILKAYGVKSPDGKRFIKNQQLTDEFTQTEAYSELYTELCTDADKAAAFMNAVVPKIEENRDAPNVVVQK